MGMKELLSMMLEHDSKMCSYDNFKGKSIAIDGSGWIQKTLLSTIDELIDVDFADYRVYVDYMLVRIRNFRLHGIEPIVVFDGRSRATPTEVLEQQETASTFLEQGKRLLGVMKNVADSHCKTKLYREAVASITSALSPTQEMITHCIAALRAIGITVVVSPYDVCAQLAYLYQANVCAAIITDAPEMLLLLAILDLAAPVLFRFDHHGYGHVLNLKNFGITNNALPDLNYCTAPSSAASITPNAGAAKTINPSRSLSHLRLHGTPTLFVTLGLLCGTKYQSRLRHMGVAVIHFRNTEPSCLLRTIIASYSQNFPDAPPCYVDKLNSVVSYLKYQPVYDPRFQELIPLMPYSCTFGEYLKLFPAAIPAAPHESPISCYYEGKVCIVTHAVIEPSLPWNISDVSSNSTPVVGALPDSKICSRSNIWSTRKHLMKIFATSGVGSSGSSDTVNQVTNTVTTSDCTSVAKQASKDCTRLVLDILPQPSDNIVSPPTSPPTTTATPCISPELAKRATTSTRLSKKGLEYDNYKKRVLETLELSPRLTGKKSRNSKNTPQKTVPLLR